MRAGSMPAGARPGRTAGLPMYGEPGGPMGAPWWGIRAPDGIPGRWGWGGGEAESGTRGSEQGPPAADAARRRLPFPPPLHLETPGWCDPERRAPSGRGRGVGSARR